ncbi:MAG: glycosyltransferase [Xanthomonadales bacterium]|nr:glycosyltransferase [Xanthomonadales bacterium]
MNGVTDQSKHATAQVALSIVTVHKQDFGGLRRTIESLMPLLRAQSTEWILVDGGSTAHTDEHAQTLARAESLADHFLAGPDDGIYDAMNKGTDRASGKWVLYLNSGDELAPAFDFGGLLSEVDGAEVAPAMIWAQCEERYEDGNSVLIRARPPRWAWYGMPAYHPAIVFRRSELGSRPYDTSFTIAADYDLVCRLLVNGAGVRRVNTPVSIFHRGGLSDRNHERVLVEEQQVRTKHFPRARLAGLLLVPLKQALKRLSGNARLRRAWRRWT